MFEEKLTADLCVVGGGLSGMCAAIAAARRGVKVILVQDRPVLGGNASSEIRMHVCGSRGMFESGIVEELRLANLARNPHFNYPIWDSVMYEKVREEANITLLLNASCIDAVADGDAACRTIRAIKVWQLTTYTMYTVTATYFVDASGDSILAEPSGAEFHIGHEARKEYNETIAPVESDRKVMGMSTLIQFREYPGKRKFIAPKWANRYPDDASLFHRCHGIGLSQNFWWIEFGGDSEPIRCTETVREELMKAAYGIADHIKNVPGHNADNWDVEWIGALPGKRESRRYVGDHVLTEHDVRAEGKFSDIVAYGGWPMDDHNPAGFHFPGDPNIFHPAPDVFGIPYRCLYSKNVRNLWMAGRNVSVSHVALSSTRVMATCAVMGEAVGCAAAIAVQDGLTPREVGEKRIDKLQQNLLDNDCYLPGIAREISALCKNAEITVSRGDGEPLRSGSMRGHVWEAETGDFAEYTLPQAAEIHEVRLVLDSDLVERHARQERNMKSNYPLDLPLGELPATLLKSFRISIQTEDGKQVELHSTTQNERRLMKIPVAMVVKKIRLEALSKGGVVSFDFR